MKNFHFKYLIIFFAIFILTPKVAAMTTTENIANIENQIFGYENKNLNENDRLNTIEKFVYGTQQNLPTNERLKKLNTDLGIDSNPSQRHYIATQQPYNEENYANEPTDPTAQYPIVDNLENSLLKKTYKTENIYKRLERLEKKAYGKVISGSLSERVDNLAMLVEPITPEKTREAFNDYITNSDEYNYFSPSTNGNPRSSGGNLNTPTFNAQSTPTLFNLEKNILGKSYPEEPNAKRLSRLEKKVLHKEFSTEPEQLRIERLATISAAQQSSANYKENKLMQHLSAGVQIGSMILLILAMIL